MSVHCLACYGTHVHLSDPEFIICKDPACGLIAAADRTTTVLYDQQYVADRYDRYKTTNKMSWLRRELVQTILYLHDHLTHGRTGSTRGRLLDVGYGNGAFIREARGQGWDAFGNDVNPTPYPLVRMMDLPTRPLPPQERFRAITFFDALEHFEDLEEVRKVALNTDWIILSFPHVPVGFPAIKHQWKHYRAGEHHLYLSPQSVKRIFESKDRRVEIAYQGNPEDIIRGQGLNGQPNITTVALRVTDRGSDGS